MRLQRVDFLKEGIFGDLLSDDGEQICKTLEHAYETSAGYFPKLPRGTYECVRGTHQLAHSGPFETFEIEGVEGHSGILFHTGNINADSAGCVLVGLEIRDKRLYQSRTAFLVFMSHSRGLDSFQLVVT